MFKGLGQLGDMAKVMKQAQDLQGKISEMQNSLGAITVTGESGAGLVHVTATAKGELTGLDIDASIFRPEDKEVAEDLILAAIKDVQAKAEARRQAEIRRLTEEMGLPADMNLPL
ncbi:MAG: YbaB/EbfC family nucleoid-associated protein [Halocynthiibacter sp.]